MPAEYKKDAGPFAVSERLYDWLDVGRDRMVPVKLYLPEDAEGPRPVVLFSHGLGGSREGASYLGNHWASHGYVSVHIQHIGSDTSAWQGKKDIMKAMREVLANPQHAMNRPQDVSFVIDQLEQLNQNDPVFKNRLDLDKIGMSGHSFGAYTTLAISGQVNPGLFRDHSQRDVRIKASVILSPTAPQTKRRLERRYSPIEIPCLHMTGTLDDSPVNDSKAADRRIPFDHIQKGDQYLVIFDGGDHMVFSGRSTPGRDDTKDPVFHDLIRMSTTAFWDGYLQHSETARRWLGEGPFTEQLEGHGTLETKNLADDAPD